MTFSYPALAMIGAALALAPIVIHLLNRRRRRRVEWAAMDFLLKSQRKNRTRVRLSEWLLLAARVAVIALVGLFAAAPKTADLLEGFFGADHARHLVVLDDSCSMRRRDAGRSAWREALDALQRLAVATREAGDELVVIRYADKLAGREPATVVADAAQGDTDPAAWAPGYTAAGPDDALARLRAMLDDSPGGARQYAYVFSDFAERTHDPSALWADALRDAGDRSAGLVLAACGDPQAGNLTIERLTLAPGPVAAGVETRLVVEVVNHSAEESPPVAVTIRRNGQPLAGVEVGPFEPGARRTVEAPITFAGVGLHVVDAALPEDRLAEDNRRWLAVDAPASQSVLLVDDSDPAVETRVFAAALRPRGKTRSGWAPRRVSRFTREDLAESAAVMLLDVERLAAADYRALRDHLATGGGVLWVLGPRTDADAFNRAVAGVLGGEKELVPWRLGPPTSSPTTGPDEPMLRASDHPVVRVLGGARNGFLPLVRTLVHRRLEGDDEPASLTRVAIASPGQADPLLAFADGQPLLVENRYGAGRLVALFTSAATGEAGAPPWSNLATLPVFPVLANDLVGWLAQERLRPDVEPIGATAASAAPARSALLRWDAGADLVEAAGLGDGVSLAPAEPGVYRRVLGGVPQPAFAAVVDPSEGDLRGPTVATLRQAWGDLARVGRADALFRDAPTPASRTPLYATAVVLLVLLTAERLLAFRNSYVASAAGGRS